MSTDLVATDPNSIPSETANPTEPVNDGGEMVKTGSQADYNRGNAPISDETFFTGDVKNMPPQLRPAYDNMLRDYKSKTEKIASERKEIESLKEKASLYEQISSDEEFVKYWNSLAQKGSGIPKSDGGNGQEIELGDEEFLNALQNPREFMKLFKKLNEQQIQTVQSKVEEAHKKIAYAETSQLLESFSKASDDKGQLLHPDYKELEDLVVDGNTSLLGVFVSLDPAPQTTAEQKMEKLERAYVKAKKFHDILIEKGKKVQMESLTKKMRSSTEPPGITGDGNEYAGEAKDLSVRDALRLAKKGITVNK